MQSGIPAFLHIGNRWELQGIARNSWLFLAIPELQISHGWPDDHLQSLNKCKAEFLHFLHIGNHWESVGIAGIPGHSCPFQNYKNK